MPKPTDIELTVGLTATDVKESAKDLSKSIKDIFQKSSGTDLDAKMQKLQQRMSQTTSKTQTLLDKMAKLEQTKIPTDEYKEVSKRLEKLNKQFDNLMIKQEELEQAGVHSGAVWDRMNVSMERIGTLIREDEIELQRLVETGKNFILGSDTEQYTKLQNDLANINNESRMLINTWDNMQNEENEVVERSYSIASVWRGITNTFQKVGTVIKRVFQTIIKVIKQTLNLLKKLIAYLRTVASKMWNFVTSLKHVENRGSGVNFSLKRMLSSMLALGLGIRGLTSLLTKMRSGIISGVQALVKWEGENGKLNKSISSVQSAISTLKNNLGAMVAPLINALAPALTRIINMFNLMIEKVSMFIAALTGQKTYLSANKVQENYAKSLENTGKAAKKAKKELEGYLSPIDEINKYQSKLNADDDSDSDIGGGFTRKKIDSNMIDWIKKLKDMWKDADFTKLGANIGKKLLKALQNIPWKKIKAIAGKLGKSLATLINGFVRTPKLGYTIGKTLAESINTAFEFLNKFVHNLDWKAIGTFIAETFNGWFENIDWDLIEDTVITGLRGLADAIWEFIFHFDWNNISKTFVRLATTLSKGIKAFFEQPAYDERGFKLKDSWAKRLGKELGIQLKKIVEETPWREVGEALGDIIQAAIDFVSGIFEQLPSAQTLVEKLTEFTEGLFDKVDSEQLGTTVGGLLQYAWDVLYGYWTTNGPTIWEETKKFFSGFFSAVDVKKIKEDVLALLTAAKEKLEKFWDEHGDEIKQNVADFFSGIWDFVKDTELAQSLGEILAKALGLVIGLTVVKSALQGLGFSIGQTLVGAGGAAGGAAGGVGIIGGILAGLAGVGLGLGISELLKDNWADVGKIMAEIFGDDLSGEDMARAEQQLQDYLMIIDGASGSADMLKNSVKDLLRTIGIDVPESTYAIYDQYGNVMRIVDESGKVVEESAIQMEDAVATSFEKTGETIDRAKEKADDFATALENIKKSSVDEIMTNYLPDDWIMGLKHKQRFAWAQTDKDAPIDTIFGGTRYTKEYFDELQEEFGFTEQQIGELKKALIDVTYESNTYEGTLKELADIIGYIPDKYEDMTKATLTYTDAQGNITAEYNRWGQKIIRVADDSANATTQANDKIVQSNEAERQEIEKTSGAHTRQVDLITKEEERKKKGVEDNTTQIVEEYHEQEKAGAELTGALTGQWKQQSASIKDNSEIMTDATKKSNDSMTDSWENLMSSIKSSVNSILGFVEKLVNGVIDAFNDMGDKLGTYTIDVPDWIPKIGGKHFELGLPRLDRISIPRLAQGAVIPPNKQFLAMLGDQTSGTNIETPLNTMIDAFNQALAMNGGSQKIILNLMLPDKRTVAQYAIEGGQILQSSRGYNPFMLERG